MDKGVFGQVRDGMKQLTIEQLRQLVAEAGSLLKAREADALVVAHREHNRKCPHCGGDHFIRWGVTKGRQRWFCKPCERAFTDATGTPLGRMKNRDKFLGALTDMLSVTPKSCRKLAQSLEVDKMTIWRWRHRAIGLLSNFGDPNLSGTVEADETFFRESRKGSREWVNYAKGKAPPPPRPRWIDYLRGRLPLPRGLSRWQRPVLVLRDRHGQTKANHLPALKYEHFEAALDGALAPDAMLFADHAAVYRRYARVRRRALEQINARRGILVRDGVIHIQNANSFHSRLKEFMAPFRGPASKNLAAYVGWMTFRERYQTAENPPADLFKRVLAG